MRPVIFIVGVRSSVNSASDGIDDGSDCSRDCSRDFVVWSSCHRIALSLIRAHTKGVMQPHAS